MFDLYEQIQQLRSSRDQAVKLARQAEQIQRELQRQAQERGRKDSQQREKEKEQ